MVLWSYMLHPIQTLSALKDWHLSPYEDEGDSSGCIRGSPSIKLHSTVHSISSYACPDESCTSGYRPNVTGIDEGPDRQSFMLLTPFWPPFDPPFHTYLIDPYTVHTHFLPLDPLYTSLYWALNWRSQLTTHQQILHLRIATEELRSSTEWPRKRPAVGGTNWAMASPHDHQTSSLPYHPNGLSMILLSSYKFITFWWKLRPMSMSLSETLLPGAYRNGLGHSNGDNLGHLSRRMSTAIIPTSNRIHSLHDIVPWILGWPSPSHIRLLLGSRGW